MLERGGTSGKHIWRKLRECRFHTEHIKIVELPATAVGPEFLILKKCMLRGSKIWRYSKRVLMTLWRREPIVELHRVAWMHSPAYKCPNFVPKVDCWSCDGTEGEGSLLFGLSSDCLHWKTGMRLNGPWLWSNSAFMISVSGNQSCYLKTTISGSYSLDGAFRYSFRHLILVLRNLKVQIHFIYIKHILKQLILFWDLSLQCSVLTIREVLHRSNAHRTEGHTPAQMSLT